MRKRTKILVIVTTLTAAIVIIGTAAGMARASSRGKATTPAGTGAVYFAEGTVRPNFETYFCIQNPGSKPAEVTLTYMKGDGSTATDEVTVAPLSRATVTPRTRLGTGDGVAYDFSTRVECTNGQQVVAERPMYFNYNGVWTGGHDVVGTTPSSLLLFAEGTVRPNFETYFCIQNPGDDPAEVTLTYMKGDGSTATDEVTVAPLSRATVTPRTRLGTGDGVAYDFSTRVECTNGQQVVAERPMYFNYNGVWTGGHDAVGATPSTSFLFAEGTVRPNFETYLTLLPSLIGKTDSTVTITYMLESGKTETQKVPVKANTRTTVRVKDRLGEGDDAAHDFSIKLECPIDQQDDTGHLLFDQVIAERPMYFNYKGMWTGGHDAGGAYSPASTFYFAEGTARPDFETYFCIQNPGSKEAMVRITYMKGDGGTATQSVTISPNSRTTIRVKDRLGEGNDPAHDFSSKVECTNGQGIIAERPMYFNYNGAWTGGHDVVGLTP